MEAALTQPEDTRITFKPWIPEKSWIDRAVYFLQAVRQGLRLIRRPVCFPPMGF